HHQYLDDGASPGNATASDAYHVALTVSDDDTGSNVTSADVTVNNVAPTLTSVTGDTINENGTATVCATITDPGTLDVFAVLVNWQDGSASSNITGLAGSDASGSVGLTNYTWVAATHSLTLHHQYL